MHKLISLIVFLLYSTHATAAIYKCDDGTGTLKYQGTPCASGQKQEKRTHTRRATPPQSIASQNDEPESPHSDEKKSSDPAPNTPIAANENGKNLQCGAFNVTNWKTFSVQDVALLQGNVKAFDGEVVNWPCANVSFVWRGRSLINDQRNWNRIGGIFNAELNDGRPAKFFFTRVQASKLRFKSGDNYQGKFCFSPHGDTDVEIQELACSAKNF